MDAKDIHLEKAREAGYHPRFHDWLLTHWSTWQRFRMAADAVKAKGITKYSAFVIVNVLRYRADTAGKKFSMSNTLVPDLARLYNAIHGDLFAVSSRFAHGTDNKTVA